MKRVLTALLAVLYLSLASGMTVYAHYCMGKMIGTSLAHPAAEQDGEHSCDLCGMKKGSDDGGCCHDEEASFKVTEAQKGAASVSVPAVFIADLPARVAYPGALEALRACDVAAGQWANAPPPHPPAVPIFLRVCSFRI